MLKPEVGQKAPDVTLLIDTNEKIPLSSMKGKNIVLYFYPKDNTPGCTLEAQDFSKRNAEFKELNTIVIGVSKDDLSSHEKFKSSCDLNITLASDLDGSICEAYGVWVEKTMFLKKYFGVERSTFLIDSNGVLRKIWKAISASGHADNVLKEVRNLD